MGYTTEDQSFLFAAEHIWRCVGGLRPGMIFIRQCLDTGDAEQLRRAQSYVKEYKLWVYVAWVTHTAIETLDKFRAAREAGLGGMHFEAAGCLLETNCDRLLAWFQRIEDVKDAAPPGPRPKRPSSEDDSTRAAGTGPPPPAKKRKLSGPDPPAAPKGQEEEGNGKDSGDRKEAPQEQEQASGVKGGHQEKEQPGSGKAADPPAGNTEVRYQIDEGDADAVRVKDELIQLDILCAANLNPDTTAAAALLDAVENIIPSILALNAARGHDEEDLDTLRDIQRRHDNAARRCAAAHDAVRAAEAVGDDEAMERARLVLASCDEQLQLEAAMHLSCLGDKEPVFEAPLAELLELRTVLQGIVRFADNARFGYRGVPRWTKRRAEDKVADELVCVI